MCKFDKFIKINKGKKNKVKFLRIGLLNDKQICMQVLI